MVLWSEVVKKIRLIVERRVQRGVGEEKQRVPGGECCGWELKEETGSGRLARSKDTLAGSAVAGGPR